MHAIRLFVEGLILHHGYSGFFVLTALDQFIFPIPVDLFFGFAIEHGLLYGKLMFFVVSATLIGVSIGYLLGKTLGHPALTWLVGKEKVEKGERIIKKWGIWGVMMVGFTPFPFKIIAWAAGIFEMPFSRFLLGVLLGLIPRYFVLAYAGARFFQTHFYATTDMSAIILGTLQGLAEFLPISSSGHLVVMEHFLRLPIPARQMQGFDIFLHSGSLMAIVIYFWKDWWQVIKDCGHMLKKFKFDRESLAFRLAAGTLPAVAAGLMFGDLIDQRLRNLHSVAFCFIVIGLIYFYVSSQSEKETHKSIGLKESVVIGLAQAVALIPGLSRTGLTISAGMNQGISRKTAARFSFLLGGIAILAANVYSLILLRQHALPDTQFILLGTATAFIVSLLSISLLIRFLEKYTLRPFGIYLILVGSFILSFL